MSDNAAAQAEAPAPAPGQPPGITPTVQPQDPAIPENARQAFMAAAQRHQAGDNEGAMKLYMRALELHPPFADAYNNIGVILRAQEKLSAAAACFQRALAIRE